ncbi:hypothetical protein ACFWNT_08845 [Streptomyces sp. NPDC058409]|uniref:hypothetical protein n=1 Tax=Streptomyces sp. NPDC058409 TaxID=3346484 RepID=UPI003668824F
MQPAVILLQGGPGLPDYLGDVAPMVADLAPLPAHTRPGPSRAAEKAVYSWSFDGSK